MTATARVKKVNVPIDEHTARYAWQVEYHGSQDPSSRWYFHSIHEHEYLANYVANLINDSKLPVPLFR